MTLPPLHRLLPALAACLLCACASAATPAAAPATDPVAENMLLLQTPSGGWYKHYHDKKVD